MRDMVSDFLESAESWQVDDPESPFVGERVISVQELRDHFGVTDKESSSDDS